MNILLVEDDPTLRSGLEDLLSGDGHEVDSTANGIEAVRMGTSKAYDLVVLDVMLPGMNGIDVCRELRQIRPGGLVLMLTAKGSEDDKVQGLGAGADDYMTKPFGARELLARVRAMERRARATPADPQVVECDHCRIDLGRCQAVRDHKTIDLTAREAGIIRWLYRHRTRAVTRSELLEQLWAVPGSIETRTVDMTIANLRKKIERDPHDPKIIVSVKGVGYAWGES